jgi:hypothetical protein
MQNGTVNHSSGMGRHTYGSAVAGAATATPTPRAITALTRAFVIIRTSSNSCTSIVCAASRGWEASLLPTSTHDRWTPSRSAASPTPCSRSKPPAATPPPGTAASGPAASSSCGTPQTIAPIAGTRWAAYNAVTEYLDHVAPIRGARTACDASAARALRGISAAANTQSMKAQAFRMLQTL